MGEKLSVITGANLQQAIRKANEAGLTRECLVGIVNMPNSSEFNVIYWRKYEQSSM